MNTTVRYAAVTILTCSIFAGQAFAMGGQMSGGGHGNNRHMGSQTHQGGMMAGTNQSAEMRNTEAMPMHQGSNQQNQMHTAGQHQTMGAGTAAGSTAQPAPQPPAPSTPAGN